MGAPTGYLLCATPRTGSTLLCSLLSSTGVLGRPQSYFRELDEAAWARRLGVPVTQGRARDYRAFVRSVRAAATTSNGVFGARIMWGSLDRIVRGLEKSSDRSDRTVLEESLGRLDFLHLVRGDVVEQAVSWGRAEQTGYWQSGDTALSSPRFDLDQLTTLVGTIQEHNAAWRTWFASNEVQPHVLMYEELVGEQRRAVESIATHLGVALPTRWHPEPTPRRQADRTSDA